MDCETFMVPKNTNVNDQPVFLRAIRDGTLIVEEAMKEHSLNEKLKLLCEGVGLFARFTMYSFRRTAIIETRRHEGAEAAQQLAGHATGSRTIDDYYDNEKSADKDLTALRLGETPVSRDEIRRVFHEIVGARVVLDDNGPCGDYSDLLKLEMDTYVQTIIGRDPEWLQAQAEYDVL